LYREALHEVYIPRIQRGKACFAANVLGATGALLSVLAHFFERGRWGSPVETLIEGQNLTLEDQLFVLMQAALYLTATRGLASTEAQTCYERAESLCHSLNRPALLYSTLIGQWRYPFVADKLSAALGRTTSPFVGNGAKQPRRNDRSLSGFGIDALLFGRVRDRETIRDAWGSDMAVGGRTV